MNSSAKVIAISLLAAWALGVGVMSACTVTSGTVNDADGGTTTPAPSDSTAPPGDTPDTGTVTPPVCDTKQDANAPIRSAGCQACLNGKCCTQLTNCFAIAADVTCGDYHDCIEACNGNTTCEENCDLATADSGVVEAYAAISECGNGANDAGPGPDNCQTECSQ